MDGGWVSGQVGQLVEDSTFTDDGIDQVGIACGRNMSILRELSFPLHIWAGFQDQRTVCEIGSCLPPGIRTGQGTQREREWGRRNCMGVSGNSGLLGCRETEKSCCEGCQEVRLWGNSLALSLFLQYLKIPLQPNTTQVLPGMMG